MALPLPKERAGFRGEETLNYAKAALPRGLRCALSSRS